MVVPFSSIEIIAVPIGFTSKLTQCMLIQPLFYLQGIHAAENSINSAGSNQSQPECGRVMRRRQLQHSKSGSIQSNSSSPGRSPSVLSKKGMTTPRGRKGMTPSSLRKILAKGKSPWRKLEHSEEVSSFHADTLLSQETFSKEG